MPGLRSCCIASLLLLTAPGSVSAAGPQCLIPLQAPGVGNIGAVQDTLDAGNGERLIGAASGLYRLDAAWGLTPLRPPSGGDIGTVEVTIDAGNGERLIGTTSGLYRLGSAGELTAVRPTNADDIGNILDIVDAGNDERLVRYDAWALPAWRGRGVE